MNEYIFYTTEGYNNVSSDECLIIGRSFGKNMSEAKNNLLKDNQWIVKAKFKPSEFIAKQVLSDQQIADIKTIVDYLWIDEKRHYEEWTGIDAENESQNKEGGTDSNHIFSNLRRLKLLLEQRVMI